MLLYKQPPSVYFDPVEEVLYWDIYQMIDDTEPPDVRQTLSVLKTQVPVAPSVVDVTNARKAQEILAECANNATALGDSEITLVASLNEWKEIFYHAERLYRMGLTNRLAKTTSKTKENREFEAELMMGNIVKIHHHISARISDIESVRDLIKSRLGQLDRVHKTVSRQVTILEMVLSRGLSLM